MIAQALKKEIQASPTVYRLSGESGHKRTVEELYLACLLFYLLSDEPRDRYKGFYYLKAVPEEAITDPAIRTLYKALRKTCGKGNGELGRPTEEFWSILVDNIRSLNGSVADLAEYYGLAMSGELVPYVMLREFAQEVLLLWKRRRIAQYQKFIAERPHSYETLKAIFEKIREIEEYDPIFDDQRAKEEETLLAMAISPEDLEKEVEWLYPGFIAPGTINFWYAPSSQGKSVLTFSIACQLLRSGKVDKVLYFDGDNAETALRERRVSKFLREYRNQFYYFQPKEAKQFWEMLKRTKAVRGKILIVVDTLQRMAGGLDINKTSDALKIMDLFREIVNTREEDSPATLIVLHHVNKPPTNGNSYKLIERLKGSTVFADSCDVAYFFTKRNRDGNILYICLENSKDRVPVRPKICFRIEVEKAWVEEVDEILSDEEQRFVNVVVSFIRETYRVRNKWPTKEHLLKHLKDEGFAYHRSRNLLDRWEGKYWKKQKDPNTPRGYVYTLRSFEDLKFYNFVNKREPGSFEDSEFLNFCSFKNRPRASSEDSEDLNFCRIKEYQGKEENHPPETSGQNFKNSKLQKFKTSRLQDSGGVGEHDQVKEQLEQDLKTSKIQNFNSSNNGKGQNCLPDSSDQNFKNSKIQNFNSSKDRPVGIRSDLPPREVQEKMIEEYLRHHKPPYEEEYQRRKTANCRKCKYYDSKKSACLLYLGQPVIPNLTAKSCPHYRPLPREKDRGVSREPEP